MKSVLRFFLKILLLFGVIGSALSIIIPIIYTFILKNDANGCYMYFLLGIPFIIVAWPYGIFKGIKARESKYGIRFWGAIKNVPKCMNLLLVITFPGVLVTCVIMPEIGMLGILPLFDYISLLIYLSSLLEK